MMACHSYQPGTSQLIHFSGNLDVASVRTLSSGQGHQSGHTLTIAKNQLNFLISIRIFIFTLISLFQEVGNLLIIGGRKVIFSILTSILVVLILLQLSLQQLVCI